MGKIKRMDQVSITRSEFEVIFLIVAKAARGQTGDLMAPLSGGLLNIGYPFMEAMQ